MYKCAIFYQPVQSAHWTCITCLHICISCPPFCNLALVTSHYSFVQSSCSPYLVALILFTYIFTPEQFAYIYPRVSCVSGLVLFAYVLSACFTSLLVQQVLPKPTLSSPQTPNRSCMKVDCSEKEAKDHCRIYSVQCPPIALCM